MRVQSVAVSEVGHVREHNEDAVFTDDELGLWLVADGMGGHAAGEVASQLALESVARDVRAGEGLVDAVCRAHLAIKAEARDNPERQGMGTTIVAVRKTGRGFKLAWSGDSRIYAWNASGQLQQLTADHSFVTDMVARGVLTEEEAQTHPKKNLITQALGMPSLTHIRPGESTFRPKGYRGLMLCSDGVTDMLDVDELSASLQQGETLEERAMSLKKSVCQTEASDNFSFVLLEITSGWRSRMGRLLGGRA